MADHIKSLPKRLQEEVSEGGDNFSAGQRQVTRSPSGGILYLRTFGRTTGSVSLVVWRASVGCVSIQFCLLLCELPAPAFLTPDCLSPTADLHREGDPAQTQDPGAGRGEPLEDTEVLRVPVVRHHAGCRCYTWLALGDSVTLKHCVYEPKLTYHGT